MFKRLFPLITILIAGTTSFAQDVNPDYWVKRWPSPLNKNNSLKVKFTPAIKIFKIKLLICNLHILYMLSNSTRNVDGTYGPTKKGKYYKPKLDHRSGPMHSHKTHWAILENQEFTVFEFAEARIKPKTELFCKENDCYFSIIDDAKFVMGKGNERVAKFPTPQNVSDGWHGYPVRCNKKWDTPGDDLLDIMEKEEIISATTKRRIERGVI